MSRNSSVMDGVGGIEERRRWLPLGWRPCVRRARGGESGAIALEFALVAPLFLVLLGGLIEFGNIFLVRAEMTTTARETVRRVSVGALTEKSAVAFAEERLTTVSAAKFSVDVDETELDDDLVDVVVSIDVPLADVMWLDFDAWLSLVGDGETTLADITLSVSATMLKE